jgi:hypothetical protein
MSRHAYLYLAHNDLECLQHSIDLVDNPKNDIFVHVDLKCKKPIELKVRFSKIYLIKRIKVYWGGYSQTEATYRLLDYAKNTGQYDYYHLLAENELPVKAQDFIHDFFDKDNQKFLYFHTNKICNFKLIVDRTSYYYPFIETNAFRHNKVIKGASLLLGKVQKLLFVNRRRTPNKCLINLYNGWEWFSIPEDFVEYLLEKESIVRKAFHHTLAAEEVFFMTLAANNDLFNKRIYAFTYEFQDIIRASKVYQDWSINKKPKIFDMSDYDNLMKDTSDRFFFARKFNSTISKELILKIKETIYMKSK